MDPIPAHTQGGVVERFMAAVLKTAEAKASVGSNPTPSASFGSLNAIEIRDL